MNSPLYVVQGSASHFIDECMVMTRCVRCSSHVGDGDDWATIAQVIRRMGTEPVLCGGILCLECRDSFLDWVGTAGLNEEVDSG